jgi:hypothetical protein
VRRILEAVADPKTLWALSADKFTDLFVKE